MKELLPVVEVKEGDYREITSVAEFDEYLGAAGREAPLALAIPAEHTETAEPKKMKPSRAATRVRVLCFCSRRADAE